jgi:hypothetical protein
MGELMYAPALPMRRDRAPMVEVRVDHTHQHVRIQSILRLYAAQR